VAQIGDAAGTPNPRKKPEPSVGLVPQCPILEGPQIHVTFQEAQRMISFTSSVMSVRDASSIQRSGVTVCSEPAAHGDDPRREQTHR
jgi:hypothetical protein